LAITFIWNVLVINERDFSYTIADFFDQGSLGVITSKDLQLSMRNVYHKYRFPLVTYKPLDF
jgi:hypothetical protein